MQTIIITGRLGDNSEQKQVGGSDLLTFSVASDQGFGDKKTTNWFKCDLWGKRGVNLSHYLLKGTQVTVAGELEIVNRDGKTYHNIRVADVALQGGAKDGTGASSPVPGANQTYGGSPARQTADLDDDVPFITSSPEWEGRVS